MTEAIRVALLISSDKGAKGEREDLSGPAIAEKLQGLAEVVATAIVADNKDLILEKLIYFADRLKVDIVFTSGGTGLAPRDVTPEATLLACERIVPGITDAMRLKSFEVTLDVFLPVIEHAVETLRGEAYECAR